MYKKIDIMFIRRTITDWGKVLVLLLDEAAVLLLGILVFIIHVAVISSFHKRTVTGSEGMVGAQGRVVELLNPVGAIFVAGERWRAISVDNTIDVDENVEIVGVEGLTLRVKRKGADIA